MKLTERRQNITEEIKKYTKEDFLFETGPFEDVYKYKDDNFMLQKQLIIMSEQASKVGIRNFKTLFSEYVKAQKRKYNPIYLDNSTQFDGQPMELNAGDWKADEFGIYRSGPDKEEIACVHPIMPVLRLVNIDTGIEKLKIAYRKGKVWRSIIADKKTLASNNSIIQLADVGIAVTSENSKLLVRFVHDIENLNYDIIPEKNSVSRLGWIDEDNFSPYVDELEFDGDANFRTYFESVKEHGSFEKWVNMAREIRKGRIYSRLILAGSFASVLVKKLGGLPFFIHLWGGTESGKTVGLMLAASVWANPEVGRYIHTFNSTAVGREKSAAFVNSMPLIIDELQIVKDKKEFDKDIYMLSEGAGRTRGNKTGGVDQTPTWANCILTSGEMPLVGQGSGGGAVNRIIEVECKEKLFENPKKVADTLKANYGHAGKLFVMCLQQEGVIERAQELFDKYYDQLSKNDTTEKQALAAALILTADKLATDTIFLDDKELTCEEIGEFLQTKASVSINDRAYDYICEYVVQNKNKFCGESELSDVWGKLDGNTVSIVRREFNRICDDAGFNATALLSWMKQNNKIEISGKGYSKSVRINTVPCNCIVMHLQNDCENLDDIPDFD